MQQSISHANSEADRRRRAGGGFTNVLRSMVNVSNLLALLILRAGGGAAAPAARCTNPRRMFVLTTRIPIRVSAGRCWTISWGRL